MENQKIDYKDRIQNFKNRVATEPAKGAIQKVVPIKTDVNNKLEEIQLGVFIPKSLMKRLKTKALSEDKTIKEVVNDILDKQA